VEVHARVRVIRIALTPEQRLRIREATGEDVVEAVLAAPVAHNEPLTNELCSAEEQELGSMLWNGNDTFFSVMSDSPEAARAFERRFEHVPDPRWPVLTVLR